MVGLIVGVEVAAARTGGSHMEDTIVGVGLFETGTWEGDEGGGDEIVGEVGRACVIVDSGLRS